MCTSRSSSRSASRGRAGGAAPAPARQVRDETGQNVRRLTQPNERPARANRREMQLREEVKERERLGEELKKANAQIEVANTELTKANKIIEDEAAAIAEWKTKVDMESKTVADLTNQLKDKQNETEYLVREVKMLSDYAKRKDSALGLVMGTLSKTEKAKSEAQAQAAHYRELLRTQM